MAGLDFEARPMGGGDLAEFAFADEVEVEEDEGEISVVGEEVGGLEGLGDVVATDPEEASAFLGGVGSWVEGILAIDEGEGEGSVGGEEFGNEESGAGGGGGRDDFAEMTGGEGEIGWFFG